MSWFKKKKHAIIDNDTVTEKRIAKLEELVDFLCYHDRDDVIPDWHQLYYPYSTRCVKFEATYIANNEVKTVVIGTFCEDEIADAVIIQGKMPVARVGKRYFAIDKPSGTVIEVTDLDICKGNLS